MKPILFTPIFDVDGTLVQSYELDGDLFVAAIREVLGPVSIDVEWNNYVDVTDAGILHKILAEHSSGVTPSCVAAVQQAFGRKTRACADEGLWIAVPGALQFLEHLHAMFPQGIGVATGGWSNVARIKLSAAKFTLENLVLSTSDVSAQRIKIMDECRDQIGVAHDRVAYFGDGDWDVLACKELGWRFIGVGDRLKDKCENWIPDFTDPNRVLSFLTAD